MTPIATIFQESDGTLKIVSVVQSPIELAHALSLLLPDMIRQARNPAVEVPPALHIVGDSSVEVVESAAEPYPLDS